MSSMSVILKVEEQDAENKTDDNNDGMDRAGKQTANCSENSAPSTSRASTSASQSRHKRRKVSKAKKTPEERTAEPAVKEYPQTKYESDNIYRSITQDPLTNFFLLMIQTVSTFPLPDQVEIKGILFQMVNYVEKRNSITLPHPNTHPTESNIRLQTVNQNRLTNFFLAMAETVSTFHLLDQVQIKGNLFQVVNAVEMRIASNTGPPPDPDNPPPPSQDTATENGSQDPYNPYYYYSYYYPYHYSGYDYTQRGT